MLCPLVGVLGTFVTGSATASNILLNNFQQSVTKNLGLPVLSMVGAQGFGAAVGNIVCPHNTFAGGATVGLVGKKGSILRKTMVGCLIYSTLGGLVVLWLARFQPFIYSDLSADVLRHMGRLKLIATRSTGFDHIDLAYCDANDITVCNVPVYGDNTAAEHVFALLLGISHKMIVAVDRTRRGDFSLKGLQGLGEEMRRTQQDNQRLSTDQRSRLVRQPMVLLRSLR